MSIINVAMFGDFTCYGDKDSVRTDIDAQGWEVGDNDETICDERVSKRNMELDKLPPLTK